MGEAVKGVNGEVITDPREVRKRWSDYYDELMNVEDGMESVMTGGGRRGVRGGRCMEIDDVRREEVVKALQKMKNGKATGVDEIAAEFLRKGGDSVVEWLCRLLNPCTPVPVFRRTLRVFRCPCFDVVILAPKIHISHVCFWVCIVFRTIEDVKKKV